MFGVRGENGALCLRPQLLPEQFDVRNRTSIILKCGGKAFKIVYTLLERLEPSEYTIVKAELDNMPIADGWFNKEGQLPLQLSMSIGYAFWHEAGTRGENLIQQADERMYEEKQKKKRMRA